MKFAFRRPSTTNRTHIPHLAQPSPKRRVISIIRADSPPRYKNSVYYPYESSLCHPAFRHDASPALRIKTEATPIVAEFLGTFFFLFVAYFASQGAGPLPLSDSTTRAFGQFYVVERLYIALAFGASYTISLGIFWRFSGGFFNPVVLLTLILIRKVKVLRGVGMMLAQFTASLAAAAIAKSMLPTHPALIARTQLINGMGAAQGFCLEMFVTFLMTSVLLPLALQQTIHRHFETPAAMGLILFTAEMATIPYTGGGLNPFRSFAPAVVDKTFPTYHWIYWIGPLLGAFLAILLHWVLQFVNQNTSELIQAQSYPSEKQCRISDPEMPDLPLPRPESQSESQYDYGSDLQNDYQSPIVPLKRKALAVHQTDSPMMSPQPEASRSFVDLLPPPPAVAPSKRTPRAPRSCESFPPWYHEDRTAAPEPRNSPGKRKRSQTGLLDPPVNLSIPPRTSSIFQDASSPSTPTPRTRRSTSELMIKLASEWDTRQNASLNHLPTFTNHFQSGTGDYAPPSTSNISTRKPVARQMWDAPDSTHSRSTSTGASGGTSSSPKVKFAPHIEEFSPPSTPSASPSYLPRQYVSPSTPTFPKVNLKLPSPPSTQTAHAGLVPIASSPSQPKRPAMCSPSSNFFRTPSPDFSERPAPLDISTRHKHGPLTMHAVQPNSPKAMLSSQAESDRRPKSRVVTVSGLGPSQPPPSAWGQPRKPDVRRLARPKRESSQRRAAAAALIAKRELASASRAGAARRYTGGASMYDVQQIPLRRSSSSETADSGTA
ncbi:hypothetical protein FH972_025030 [Carpinus fangiana]|uniref:Aquaporin n=1 Tax=Carpinus fangiana TaxID=176857 RepID=A0A5N6L055_9ROSI|nr:hypothetical protein FH972_025030 [Carpinus fangiana]